eukprot:4745476-Amphidinium_carterae.1
MSKPEQTIDTTTKAEVIPMIVENSSGFGFAQTQGVKNGMHVRTDARITAERHSRWAEKGEFIATKFGPRLASNAMRGLEHYHTKVHKA